MGKKQTRTLLILGFPILILFSKLFTGQVLFWGTPMMQFVPWWNLAIQTVREGAWPLWNSLSGMGSPLLANYQLAFFYPPNWLYFLFSAADGAPGIAWGQTFVVALHLIWAGFGMTLFLRENGYSLWAQRTGGIVFMLGGYLAARLNFYSMIWAAAWMPWVMYEICRIFPAETQHDTPKNSWWRLCLTLVMQLLCGHAQLTWYTLMLAGFWVVFFGWKKESIQKIPTLILAGGLALLLSSIQLFPTFEYLRESSRADEMAYEIAMTYSFWPWRILTLFSPDLFGNPANGTYWGYGAYWEDALYIGILPLILALSTIWGRKKAVSPKRRLIAWLWGVCLLSFLLALGNNTPVFPFLYRWVPTFDMFQAPARYLLWAAFSLCVLAATGMDLWSPPKGKSLFWLRLLSMGAFGITLGAGLAWFFLKDVKVTFLQAFFGTGLVTLMAGILTLLMPEEKERRKLWEMGVTGFVAIDLLCFGLFLNPWVDRQVFSADKNFFLGETSLSEGQQRVYLAEADEYILKFSRFFQFKDYQLSEDWRQVRAVGLPNMNLLEGWKSANLFDPLRPQRYEEWIRRLDLQPPAARTRWLRWMAVSSREKLVPASLEGIGFEAIQGAQVIRWFSEACGVSDGPEALSSFEDNNLSEKPFALYVEKQGLPSDSHCDETSLPEQPKLFEAARGQVLQFEVNTPQKGWVFLANLWYPGWKATVDEQEVVIYRANFLFQAIEVPQGLHQIKIEYCPGIFTAGATASGIGIVLLIFFFIRQKHHK